MNQLRNAIWMKERGHDVVVFCIDNSPIAINATQAGVPTISIEKHRKYYDFKKGLQLARLILKHGVTHLIVRATHDMSLAAIAKSKLGRKLHLSYFMEMQLGVKKTNFLHTIRFQFFNLWSCPLDWLAEQVESHTHFPKGRIEVIPSGLDLRQFQDLPSQKQAREVLDLPNDLILFGLIGRFDIHKGQLLLLKAMQRCQNKQFGIVLLGEPTRNEGNNYFDEMTSFIAEHQLSNRVFIRPFRKEIGVFYKAVDWFVMASKAETFGMVTIEAMACGTPTLGSNAGGTPEILKNGQLGVLFKSLDESDLSLKIDEIIEGKHYVAQELLTLSAKAYDHQTVCEKVEKTLRI